MSVKIVNVKISMPSSGGGGGGNVIVPPVIPPEPEVVWYDKATGLVDCSFGLIVCNEEVIECL